MYGIKKNKEAMLLIQEENIQNKLTLLLLLTNDELFLPMQ